MSSTPKPGSILSSRPSISLARWLGSRLGRAVPKGMSRDEVRRLILTELQQMETGLAECERKFGPRAKILDHPALGPLNVAEWRKFHWVHGKHHAQHIRERAGKTGV